jgi:hypothetical protein
LNERVEVDPVMTDVTLFDIYRKKGTVLVLLQAENKEPIAFMVDAVTKPKKKKKKKKLKKKKKKESTAPKKDANSTNPVLPDHNTSNIQK